MLQRRQMNPFSRHLGSPRVPWGLPESLRNTECLNDTIDDTLPTSLCNLEIAVLLRLGGPQRRRKSIGCLAEKRPNDSLLGLCLVLNQLH